jgi:phosphoribosylaminoimidazole carboxylase
MSSPSTIGLLGGGQLGLMLCEAANPLGVPITIVDAENAPAKRINGSKAHVSGSFKDPAKIRELAAGCDILTVETEHINTDVLEEIATRGLRVPAGKDGNSTNATITRYPAVHPSWRTLRLIQNKYEQKEYLSEQGIPIAEQMPLASGGEEMLASMKEASLKYGFPWMLKSRKDSYDGRGNLKISGEADLQRAVKEFGSLSCYAEKWVPFQMELSVIVVRTEDEDGHTKRLIPYPTVETIHEDNICSRVFMPPRNVAPEVSRKAQDAACSVVSKLWGRGVFAVEMFLTKEGDILVNEIAPRCHNSGHLTIEAVPHM